MAKQLPYAQMKEIFTRFHALEAEPKGEFVVIVGPGREAAATEDEAEAALRQALKSAGPAEAASEVARALGLNRRDLYRRAVAIRGEEA